MPARIALGVGLWLLLASLAAPVAGDDSGSQGLTLRGESRPFDVPYSDLWGYVDADGREYALLGFLNGMCVLDVTDPSHPTVTGTLRGENSRWRDIKTFGNYAYVVNERAGGMMIVDLGDAQNPVVAGSYLGFSQAHNLAIEERTARAYACNTDAGEILVLSLVDPLHPVLLGIYDRTVVHDLYVRDDVAYVAEIFDGQFSMLKIAPPFDFPVVGGPVRYPNALTHNTWLTDDGRHLLTTDENQGGRMRIWSIADLAAIEEVGSFRADEDDAFVHNVVVHGDRAYLSHYTAGVRIVDIADPSRPQEVAWFDTFPGEAPGPFLGAWGVYPFLPSGNLLVSDIQRGLLVLGERRPEVPVETTSWGSLRARYGKRR